MIEKLKHKVIKYKNKVTQKDQHIKEVQE